MPELPEVETVRRGLSRLVANRSITAVHLAYQPIVKSDLTDFKLLVEGSRISAVKRRGKYLIFDLGEWQLVSHLRMEGKYLVFPDHVPDNKHFHVFFELDNGATLVYQDVRKFGTMELVPQTELSTFFAKKGLGPEPDEASFALEPFEKALSQSPKKIKPYLLEQTLVVGLGNIYVDEVLWAAAIHPEKQAKDLDHEAIRRLHHEIIRILQLGIEKGGSTIRTYQNALGENGTMQDYHQVYQKTGEPCARCGTPIEKIKVGGRGTHFCPSCQKR